MRWGPVDNSCSSFAHGTLVLPWDAPHDYCFNLHAKSLLASTINQYSSTSLLQWLHWLSAMIEAMICKGCNQYPPAFNEWCHELYCISPVAYHNFHTNFGGRMVLFLVFCSFVTVQSPSWVSSFGSSLVRLLYPAEDGKSTLSLISSSAVPLYPLWSRALFRSHFHRWMEQSFHQICSKIPIFQLGITPCAYERAQ